MDNVDIIKLYREQVDNLSEARKKLLKCENHEEEKKLKAFIAQTHYNMIGLQEKYGRNGLFNSIRIK